MGERTLSETLEAREPLSGSGYATYQAFWGLTCSPFHLSPDPFFLISSEKSNEVLACISHAVQERKGLVVLTGEVGTGKTLVLRCLAGLWKRQEIPFVYFIGAKLSTVDFLNYIVSELGISITERTEGNLLRALNGFLLAQSEQGRTTVLIIDEGHRMRRSVLEEIGLLTNFETAYEKLVQIVLVGQPELERKLDSPELRSLKQRIAVRCQLEPLREEDIRNYIERRLELAGAGLQASEIFPAETVKAISRYSHGIPRLVNSICDRALVAAYARQVRTVPHEIIKAIASDFRLSPIALESEAISLPVFQRPIDESIGSGIESPFAAQSSEISRDTSSSRVRSWLTSGVRWALIISIAAVLPAVDIFKTYHAKNAVMVSQYAVSSDDTLPVGQTAAPIATGEATSLTQADLASEGATSPAPGEQIPDFNSQPGHLPPVTGVGALPRPAFKSKSAPASPEAPLIPAMPTAKQLDSGESLFSSSIPLPAAPADYVSSHLEPPKLLSSPGMSYNSAALNGIVRGPVVIDAIVDETGNVTDIKLISGNGILGKLATEQLRMWKYEPARLNGQPIAEHVQVKINFKP